LKLAATNAATRGKLEDTATGKVGGTIYIYYIYAYIDMYVYM
jgi:hypothetical protein